MDFVHKPIILQQYFDAQQNNGGPATGARLLINSSLREKYDFPIMDKTYPLKSGFLKQFRYFYSTIKRIQPDIVHIRGVQSEGFYGVLAAKLLGKKVVMSVHGLTSDLIGISGVKRFLFTHIFEKFALKKADLVYCVCKYAAERKYIKDNTDHLYGYIHNAAPQWDVQDKSVIRNKIREDLGLSEDDIVFTYIGRITKDKGIDVLLHSFEHLRKDYPSAKLCLGGIGALVPLIEKQYHELVSSNSIFLLGRVSNVQEILCASDVFVFPTLHENLSNSLLEAATVGLAIIATKVGGNPEVISERTSGLLVDPGDEMQLFFAMKELTIDKTLRAKLGNEANRVVSTKFSVSKILGEIDKVYESLLK